MDFLPRYLTCCALACALGLVSVPAFAAYSGLPNLQWSQAPDGSWSISQLSPSNFGPQGAGSFSAGSSDGVIESVAAPDLLIDSSGNISLAGRIITASRNLSIADLADGVGDLLSDSNPYGLAIMAGAGLLGLLTDAYQASPAGSSSPYSETYYCGSTPESAGSGFNFVPDGDSVSNSVGATATCSFTLGCFNNPPSLDLGEAPACSNGATPSAGPNGSSSSLSPSPSQMETYFQNNPSEIQTEFAKELADDPQYQQELADAEENNPSPIPLPTPSPYTYDVPTPDQTITGSPTTTTSTDPTTNTTTTTTTTPSYDISGGPDVTVTKSSTTDVQTCTSSGSCTTTTTTTKSNPQPKAGVFVPPSVVPPSVSPVSPTPFSLSLAVPNQSTAVCPSPLSYSAFGQTFNISVQPLCTLATNARPYVEALGAVGAGIVIFH